MIDYNGLKNNIISFNDRVKAVCALNGADFSAVKVVPAVKTVCAETVNLLYGLGIRAIGENKAQELTEKYPYTTEPFEWHFIGQLQSNKVRAIIDKVRLIHSLDRKSLADEIQRLSVNKNITTDCLVEINSSGLDTRGGVKLTDAEAFIETIKTDCKNINITGLMTVLPNDENAEDAAFKTGRLYSELKDRFDLKYLSMGMSDDFELAIKYGANLLRPGRILFGERVYK